ncbi:MAG: hypothetical protein J5U17_05570 [Candidatus Methanoperedens sp.]|nr:hypothetical protein [Candidatus Methanoperedens sp.]MCE8427090.1 hypothetical protein [Candidatus Methanoperedens sp.]
MTFKWPYATDKFTAYEGDEHTTRLSLALWIVDDCTGKQPLSQIKVRIKEGDISDEECDIKTNAGFFNAVKNPSGYYIFTDLLPRKYSCCIESDPYFPEKRTISGINNLRLLEFAIGGPAKDMKNIELKDTSGLEKGDIVEFQNLRGNIEQRKITDIVNNKTIIWTEGLKYDFSAKGSSLRVLNYILDEINLKPKPSYPFPDNATLVRGMVFGPDNLPAEKAGVKVKDLKETKTNENGEFVLYFDEADFNGLLLFIWDKIPGSDNEKLTGFLKQDYGIDWVETAEIKKTADGNTILLTKDNNSLSLKLNDEKTKVTLEINDGRTDELVVRKEKDKLNIYNNIIIEVNINSTVKIVKTNLEKGKTIISEKINF